MSGRVELVLGDMFEGPSDLVVLPCSELPTVSEFVRSKLSLFRIPEPKEPMHLGEVRLLRLSNAEQVAPTAAYAASVKTGRGTEPAAIAQIGRTLGSYAAQHRRVQLIAAPLLGSRAGGLQPMEAFEALNKGFLATSPDWASCAFPSSRQPILSASMRRRVLLSGTHWLRPLRASSSAIPRQHLSTSRGYKV